MRETWYVLEDGSSANPNEVAPDERGVLRHKDGMAVAIGAHGNHRSRGVDVDEDGRLISSSEKKPAEEKTDKKPSGTNRQMKAGKDSAAEYKTR